MGRFFKIWPIRLQLRQGLERALLFVRTMVVQTAGIGCVTAWRTDRNRSERLGPR